MNTLHKSQSFLLMLTLLLLTTLNFHIVVGQGNNTSLADLYTVIPAWNPTDTLIASATGTEIEIRDANSLLVVQTFTEHRDIILTLAWNHDGSQVATGSADGVVRVWDIKTGNTTLVYTGHDNAISSVIWSVDSTKVASASVHGSDNLHIWNVRTGTLMATGQGGTGSIMELSPNGTEIASVVGPIIATQDTNTLDVIRSFRTDFLGTLGNEDPNNLMESIAWSPDGAKLVTGNVGGSIYVWDSITLQPLATLIANISFDSQGISNPSNSWVRDIMFSADNERILSASSDGTLRAWNANTFQELSTLQINPFITAGWNSDGTQLFAVETSGESQILDTSELANGSIACDTNVAASNSRELISAITTGNNARSPYTICLEVSTYTLSPNALPIITGDITIISNGATITSDTSALDVRIFRVADGAILTLENLTLNGHDPIDTSGTVRLMAVTLVGDSGGE